MIVIVAGMQRSGSTFSYNVARELLQARGGVAAVSASGRPLVEIVSSLQEDTSHAVIKSHFPDEVTNRLLSKNGLPCLCTVRKPEDAIASWIQTFGFSLENSLATYRQWLTWHRAMHPHMLNLRYEEVDKTPLLAIRKISLYLIRKWGLRETIRIWRRYRKHAVYEQTKELAKDVTGTIDIGFSYYDRKTLLHRRHISSLKTTTAIERLAPEQVIHIRHELREFIDADGNYNW